MILRVNKLRVVQPEASGGASAPYIEYGRIVTTYLSQYWCVQRFLYPTAPVATMPSRTVRITNASSQDRYVDVYTGENHAAFAAGADALVIARTSVDLILNGTEFVGQLYSTVRFDMISNANFRLVVPEYAVATLRIPANSSIWLNFAGSKGGTRDTVADFGHVFEIGWFPDQGVSLHYKPVSWNVAGEWIPISNNDTIG